jgi:hypothetical protein
MDTYYHSGGLDLNEPVIEDAEMEDALQGRHAFGSGNDQHMTQDVEKTLEHMKQATRSNTGSSADTEAHTG